MACSSSLLPEFLLMRVLGSVNTSFLVQGIYQEYTQGIYKDIQEEYTRNIQGIYKFVKRNIQEEYTRIYKFIKRNIQGYTNLLRRNIQVC